MTVNKSLIRITTTSETDLRNCTWNYQSLTARCDMDKGTQIKREIGEKKVKDFPAKTMTIPDANLNSQEQIRIRYVK